MLESALRSSVTSFVDSADFSSLRTKMAHAKDWFFTIAMNQDDDDGLIETGQISLDSLHLELLAGRMESDRVDAIIDSFRDSGIDPVTFLDYVAYIPLFANIHQEIIANPFDLKSTWGSQAHSVTQTKKATL